VGLFSESETARRVFQNQIAVPNIRRRDRELPAHIGPVFVNPTKMRLFIPMRALEEKLAASAAAITPARDAMLFL